MIVSRAHRFIFFHNPKVGGTSMQATIGRFNDVRMGFWNANPELTGGRMVFRSHLGVDEFAELFPELWAECRGFRMFCIYRRPYDRFLSAVAEHSKMYGATDVRFCSEARRREVLFAMVDRLDALGTAESPAVMDDYELTHFKPQWIYWSSADPAVRIEAFPLERLPRFIDTISALTGTDLTPQIRNAREKLDLPAPIATLASSRTVKRVIAHLPGITMAKASLRRRYGVSGAGRSSGFVLDAAETARIDEFVRRFYAEDLSRWPAPEAEATPSGDAALRRERSG